VRRDFSIGQNGPRTGSSNSETFDAFCIDVNTFEAWLRDREIDVQGDLESTLNGESMAFRSPMLSPIMMRCG